MAQRGGGAIITVSSSTGAHDASPGNVAYVASKGGVAMLTKAMAVDHAAQGVRVTRSRRARRPRRCSAA